MSGLSRRIGERAALVGVELTSAERDQLALYYELLERWNRRINLTGLHLGGYPDAAVDRIIVEPLVTKDVIRYFSSTWLDFGSGSGSPAVPMKILAPAASLTMIESRSRKSAFLREVIRQLGLSGANVWTGRIEDFTPSEPRCAQLVTTRGVKLESKLLTAVSDLLAAKGWLAIFGPREPPDFGDPLRYDHSTGSVLQGSAVHWFARQ